MATFALIHGASANSVYWSRVALALQAGGHGVVAPDLPIGDGAATFDTYAQVVTDAVGGRGHVVVVGHSMGHATGAHPHRDGAILHAPA